MSGGGGSGGGGGDGHGTWRVVVGDILPGDFLL